MAISEQQRHALHQSLEEVLGVEEAATLMEHLPPVGWADVATKRDLDALGAATKRDLDHLDGTLRLEIRATAAELRTEMQTMRGDLRAEMQAMRGELRSEIRDSSRALLLQLTTVNTVLVGVVLAAAKLV